MSHAAHTDQKIDMANSDDPSPLVKCSGTELDSMDDFTPVKNMQEFCDVMMRGMLFLPCYDRARFLCDEVYCGEVPALVKARKIFKPAKMEEGMVITNWPEELYPFSWMLIKDPCVVQCRLKEWK
ncbi:unnamed protein product, partial [Mesorhabditis spiculigera]